MTKRLILRSWRREDAPALYALAKDPRVGPAAGWKPHKSVKESREIIKTVFSVPEVYAVVLRTSGEIIGCAGLMTDKNSNIGLASTDCELGYWIGAPYWGNGYCTEAARALIGRGFEDLAMHRIFCGYFEGNEPSRRVQEKCGFVAHHVERDVMWQELGVKKTQYVTCLSKQDWICNRFI